MSRLGDIVPKVRSKNAGPFWLTIDIFCGTPEVFRRVSEGLETEAVVARLQADATLLKRFDIDSLNVVKFSMPAAPDPGNAGSTGTCTAPPSPPSWRRLEV